MKKIFKYCLKTTNGPQTIKMPKDADLLTVQIQNEVPCLWALVDPENEPVRRSFVLIGTGWSLHGPAALASNYVGTVQHGEFVWHVFEEEV